MADFDSTAVALAAKSIDLQSELERATTECEHLSSVIQEKSEMLKTQASNFEQAATELLNKIKSSESELITRLDAFIASCTDVLHVFSEIKSSHDEQFHSVTTTINDFHASVGNVNDKYTASWESYDPQSSTYKEKQLHTQDFYHSLAADLSSDISNQIGNLLIDLESKLESEVSDFNQEIDSERLSAIVQQCGDFSSRIEEVSVSLKDSFENLSSSTESDLTGYLDSLKSQHEDSVTEIINSVDLANSAFQDIADRVSQTVDSVTDLLEIVNDITDSTNVGLNSAVKVFDEAKELLEKIAI